MPLTAPLPSPVRIHALRLLPGEDLKASLTAFATAQGLRAAFVVASVGSLSIARLRFAGREEATELTGDLEIVALSGTIAEGGAAHLHCAVADCDGVVRGGHVAEGCRVRTTAEIVLGEAERLVFGRDLAPETGYRELSLSSR